MPLCFVTIYVESGPLMKYRLFNGEGRMTQDTDYTKDVEAFKVDVAEVIDAMIMAQSDMAPAPAVTRRPRKARRGLR